MNFLPKIEEILLLAIWKLNGSAYGTSIIEQVEKDTGSSWVSGSVYSALARLKKNGFVESDQRDSETDQIGRPRIYYCLTQLGRDKLLNAQKVNRSIWQDIPDLEEEV